MDILKVTAPKQEYVLSSALCARRLVFALHAGQVSISDLTTSATVPALKGSTTTTWLIFVRIVRSTAPSVSHSLSALPVLLGTTLLQIIRVSTSMNVLGVTMPTTTLIYVRVACFNAWLVLIIKLAPHATTWPITGSLMLILQDVLLLQAILI